jgi:hypothetical protein
MMGFPSLDFIADSLDGGFNEIDLDRYDLDGNGEITAEDCPFEFGSAEAKLWWNNIQIPYAKNSITEVLTKENRLCLVRLEQGKVTSNSWWIKFE